MRVFLALLLMTRFVKTLNCTIQLSSCVLQAVINVLLGWDFIVETYGVGHSFEQHQQTKPHG
jgi:hypothetical protein